MVEKDKSVSEIVKSIDWKFAAENIDDDLHTDALFLETSVNLLKIKYGFSYSNALLIYNGHKGAFYFPREEAKELNNRVIDRLKQDNYWGKYINYNIVKKSIELERVWEKYLYFKNFSHLETETLLELYCIQLQKHYELYEFCWIPEILQDDEFGIEFLLKEIINKYDSTFNQKDILNVGSISNSKTVYKKHEEGIILIVEKILNDSSLKEVFNSSIKYIRTSLPFEIQKMIRRLISVYGYLGYHGYDERSPYDYNYYLSRINYYVQNKDEYKYLKKRLKHDVTDENIKKILGKLNDWEKNIFLIYSNWGVLKSRRRLAQLKNFYFLDMIIEEIAFRKKIPEDFIRFMVPQEFIEFLKSDNLPINIEQRSKQSLYYINNSGYSVFTGENVNGLSFINKENKMAATFRGSVAYPGYVTGQAYVVHRKSDIDMNELGNNAILVSKEADPDIFIVFDKIKAIVTDQGGITCHVASLAREFSIPCIIGTKYATQKIKHGDTIIVDGYSGIVQIVENINND